MTMFSRRGFVILTVAGVACGGTPPGQPATTDGGQPAATGVGQPSAETMSAVRINEFGGTEVLQLEQVPHPVAGPAEMLVRVHAAAVNPVDTQIRAGSSGFASLVLDPIGGETQVRSLATLRDGGILVSLVGLVPATRSAGGDVRTTSILVRPDAAQLERIAALVDTGDLRPIVSHSMPLNQVADAHRQSETGHTRGKIVLEVRP